MEENMFNSHYFVCPRNASFSIRLALCSPPVRFHQLYKRSVRTITDCGSKQCLIEELWNLTMKYHFSLQNMGVTYGGLTQGMLCMILSVEIILIFDSAVYPWVCKTQSKIPNSRITVINYPRVCSKPGVCSENTEVVIANIAAFAIHFSGEAPSALLY